MTQQTESRRLRQGLAAASYLVAMAAFVAGTLILTDDLWIKSDRFAQVFARLHQLYDRSPRPSPQADPAGLSLFLGGKTMTIAAAALEQRVKDAIEKSGGELTSSQVEPEPSNGKETPVRLTASLEIDQPGIQKLLYDIEAGAPYLFVDKLSIQSPESSGESQAGRFRMTLTVVGQWRSLD